MKNKLNITTLPFLILGLGGIGAALRALMYVSCVDTKGLLVSYNLPMLLVAVITAAAAALVIAPVRTLEGSNRYSDNFPASTVGGVSAMLAAAGIAALLINSIGGFHDTLAAAWRTLGIIAIPCLILAGLCRIRGKRPFFLFHGMVCLFFAVNLANNYRIWSGEPQLADYLWQLLAAVGLTLTAYYRTAFNVGLGSRRMQLGVSLLTAYFCFLSMPDEGVGLFYLTCGLWALAGMGELTPKPRRRKPAQEPPREVTEES